MEPRLAAAERLRSAAVLQSNHQLALSMHGTRAAAHFVLVVLRTYHFELSCQLDVALSEVELGLGALLISDAL